MTLPQERRKSKNQNQIKLTCETRIFDFFDFAQTTINSLFPKADLHTNDNSTSESQKISLEAAIKEQFDNCKKWIADVFEQAIQISVSNQYEETPLESINVIPNIAERIFQAILKILTESGSISDNGMIFLDVVGKALKIEPQMIDLSIEQVQFDRRKEFTHVLVKFLTEKQRYWVALMLWKAIHIDDKVDYREYKYFESIMFLIDYQHNQLINIKNDSAKPIEQPDPIIDPHFCIQIYRYVIEIAMIDEEYNPQEAQFIREVGNLFGYDKTQQDEIIQPISAALMLRKSLFS